MKQFALLLAITLLPTFSLAGEFDTQINKACLRHSVSLVAKLKNNVVSDLSQQQSDEALKIATESCQAYFKKEFSTNQETVAAVKEQQENDDEEKDWLTEVMTSEQPSEKEGNKRLRRKAR